MATALITGPTSGLGRGFAEALAAQGHDLVLVSRDTARLAELAALLTERHKMTVEVLPADLSDTNQFGDVEDRLRDRYRRVEILVNNAGLGLNQPFVGGDVANEQYLLNVLVAAPMRFSHAVAPVMVENRSGAIINVSSVASWITGGTYSAAKAYLTTFTEGLAQELAGTGVTATAVCPGLIRTEFHERAEIDLSGMPGFLWLTVDDVVKQALKDADKGRPISVTGQQYKALSLTAQYAPRPLVRRFSRFRR